MANNRKVYIKGIELASKEYAESSFQAAREYVDTKDEILQGNIDLEETARIAADEVLQGNIGTEETARIAADQILQGNIGLEETARIAADRSLEQSKITHYSTMPEASEDALGDIVQYTGTTNQNYINGYFYACVSDDEDPATYSWQNINVQEYLPEDALSTFSINGVDYMSASSPFTLAEKPAGLYMVRHTGMHDFYIKPNDTLEAFKFPYHFDYLYMFIPEVITPTYTTDQYIQIYTLRERGRYFTEGFFQIDSSGINLSNLMTSENVVSYAYLSEQTVVGKKLFTTLPESSAVPVTNNQLTNKKYVDDLIASIDITKREIVEELPTEDISTKTIYMVPKSDPGSQNTYLEYMYINDAWERIGDTEIDLDFATIADVDSLFES